jgi:hypothetical protein
MLVSLLDWWGMLSGARHWILAALILWILVAGVVAMVLGAVFRRRDQQIPTLCECGCASSAHEHYRAATDCGNCGAEKCPGYRPARQEVGPRTDREGGFW